MSDNLSANSANPDQEYYWNSASGKKWITFQAGIDATFSRINERLLERARPEIGNQVLDIGCGTGATSMDFARAVGSEGTIVGIDISQQLISLAEERRSESGLNQIAYQLADAQTYGFKVNQFDLLTSRFGVMFFEHPISAFENLSTALRPGGRIVFASWAGIAGNPWFEVPRDAAVEQLGKPSALPPTNPGPLAFADIKYVLDILDKAGFAECRGEEERVYMTNPGSVEEVAHLASNIGPAARILKEFDGSNEDVVEIGREVAKSFENFSHEGGVRIPANINFFEATKINQ
jgi:SAM-dependent methyltransferase